MSLLIDMAESGWLPDRLIRLGIRQLDRKRLREENHRQSVQQGSALDDFISEMHQSPIAIKTHKANEQHYEVPAEFYRHVLGPQLKYSCCYYPRPDTSLAEAWSFISNPRNLNLITPPDLHYEMCLEAVRAGKHVLGEKPFASSPSLERITAACRAHDVCFMDATHFVHHPRTLDIKARRAELLGEVAGRIEAVVEGELRRVTLGSLVAGHVKR